MKDFMKWLIHDSDTKTKFMAMGIVILMGANVFIIYRLCTL